MVSSWRHTLLAVALLHAATPAVACCHPGTAGPDAGASAEAPVLVDSPTVVNGHLGKAAAGRTMAHGAGHDAATGEAAMPPCHGASDRQGPARGDTDCPGCGDCAPLLGATEGELAPGLAGGWHDPATVPADTGTRFVTRTRRPPRLTGPPRAVDRLHDTPISLHERLLI